MQRTLGEFNSVWLMLLIYTLNILNPGPAYSFCSEWEDDNNNSMKIIITGNSSWALTIVLGPLGQRCGGPGNSISSQRKPATQSRTNQFSEQKLCSWCCTERCKQFPAPLPKEPRAHKSKSSPGAWPVRKDSISANLCHSCNHQQSLFTGTNDYQLHLHPSASCEPTEITGIYPNWILEN